MRFHLGDVPAEPEAPPPREGWQRISSPHPRIGYLLAGLVGLAIPGVLCAGLSALTLSFSPTDAGQGTPAPRVLGAEFLALALFIPLHELVHALGHPGWGLSPRTVLVVWPSRLRFGVYYDGCMGRGRWLAMRLAPLVCLSVVPTVLLLLFRAFAAPHALDIFLQVLMASNGFGSGGDLVAVVWVAFQVPAGAQICFRGGKAYWTTETPCNPDTSPA